MTWSTGPLDTHEWRDITMGDVPYRRAWCLACNSVVSFPYDEEMATMARRQGVPQDCDEAVVAGIMDS